MSKNKLSDSQITTDTKKQNYFKQGIITNVFNPKAIVTFMAFLPQFIDTKVIHPVFQFASLGFILAFIAVLWFGLIGYFAGFIGAFIKKNDFVQNGIRYLSGSIMIALGLRIAIKKD